MEYIKKTNQIKRKWVGNPACEIKGFIRGKIKGRKG